MIVVIVKAKILAGKHVELRTVADVLQHEYAPHEEGCEVYESFIDGDTFITLERWRDQAALDTHINSAHVAQWIPKLRECLVDASFDVQFIKSDEITSVRI